MTPKYRKTLLALAISASALPLAAHALTLTNSGLDSEGNTYTDSTEVTGAFTGSDQPLRFYSDTFNHDLVLNAQVQATGDDLNGVDLSYAGDDDNPSSIGAPTEVFGNLQNKGSITVNGAGVTGLLIDPTIIHGNLVNEGTLQVAGGVLEGDGIRGLKFAGQSVLQGDLINAASGKILADGDEATGIQLKGGTIGGKLINNGLVQVSGTESTGVLATYDDDMGGPDRVDLGGIENHGSIVASGDDATALRLDGVSFASAPVQVLNTGTIQADDAAIEVGAFDIDGANASNTLVIQNSGSLISQDEAIDASQASGGVHLVWNAGSITGNLIDLSNIEVNGDVTFNGTDASTDGANIRLKDAGWLDVGSDAGNTPAHLEFGQPHTTIQGNLDVAGNSSLGLNLSSATDPNKAVVAVSGTAEFAKGSQIQLAAQGNDFKAQGTTYTLVQAGTLQDEGVSVTSRSALLNVDTYSSGDNQIVAKVSTKGQDEVGDVIGQIGGSANAQHAGAAFSQVVAGLAQSSPDDPVFQAYVNASQDPAALKKLAEQLVPEVNGGATQAATSGQTLVSNVTGNRTSSLRGASSGDVLQNTGIWAQALYSDANQDLRDGVAGFNAYSRGIAIGADGKLTDQLTLGVAYSFLHTDVNSDNGNTTDVDGNALTLYSGFEQGNYFVDANLSYGLNDNESKRRIASTTAKGDYDSQVLGANVVGGYTYHLNEQFLVEPRLAARYARVDIDGYHEKGSSAALKVDSQRYEVAELGAGVRVAGDFQVGNGNLQPQAKLMAYHDFAADKAQSTSTFVLGGTPFVSQGAKAVRNSYEAGVGADYHLGAVTVGVSYDYTGKTDFNADTFTAKVRYDF
ncbi:autotransporter domain-containing protein [Pseudomonas aeruginosa]|uniref:autotransporter family protein n=1 Tax=Pseudomonas aeruginosa TaxID=287 RepID=UPI00071C1C6F|nr:autotransporter outer membrane beta-barrel domain-containing protein [Pseudomonas aeruginosa]KSN78811.1 autotransporter domain-containing protein [Pseudomonas aeruginosa]KSR82538.1 autotransporter domain-containing protein [Pseudomonas aeruginosa]MDA3400416.1 autotransporter domain-containing protein [Pseudomonas aeruginosa]MDP5762682.1 autotransporter domain-containing protein [Pseudomonas aeruginosa]MDP5811171.1 autotransporter domain-containing protein [Pseudomonas aeruginosa]